jgi:hypothetical protein
MKALGVIALAALLGCGWWLWQRVGAEVVLNAFMQWCG